MKQEQINKKVEKNEEVEEEGIQQDKLKIDLAENFQLQEIKNLERKERIQTQTKKDYEGNNELDLELVRGGFLMIKSTQSIQTESRDIVTKLRMAKRAERRILVGYREKGEPTYIGIIKSIEDISKRNKKIEEQVKFEILGIKDKPLSKFRYSLIQLYRTKIKGEKEERAEDLIRRQLDAISEIRGDLNKASDNLNRKVLRLEDYYNRVVHDLVGKYQNREKIVEEINKLLSLLSRVEEAASNAPNYLQRVKYATAQRRIRKKIQNKVRELKLGNKAMEFFRNELPLLDNLGEVCEAYSSALKETSQEAGLMKRHLENVMGLYLDVMRSRKIDYDLDREVGKLFGYVENMNNALREGAERIVKKANEGNLFLERTRRTAVGLEEVLNEIEDSNARVFRELENRIAGYIS